MPFGTCHQGRIVKGRTYKLNNIKFVWQRKIYYTFETVMACKTKVTGENIPGEVSVMYITKD